MSESNSPIFIIISALMAVIGIGIVINITSEFGTGVDNHNDRDEFSSLAQAIERECKRLNNQGNLNFAQETTVELRESTIKLDGNKLIFDYGEKEEPRRDITCDPGLDNAIDFAEADDSGIIPIGENKILIREVDDKIQVSNP